MRTLFVGERRKSRLWVLWLVLPLSGLGLWASWAKGWWPAWLMTDPTEPTTVLESLQEASAPQTQAVNDPREPAAHNTPDAPGAVHLPIEAQVQAFVEQWARDWSQKNVGAYLEAYAADFKPEGGKSVAAWAEERKQRILSKKSISVQIQSLGIVSASDMGVTVAFVQVYAADQLVSTTQKTLLLGQREGRLRILREFTP